MYKYQVPILLEKNYDFSAVKSEKQKQLTEINGYDFSLVDVVQYLKKESKNFSEHTPLLEEIDKTIIKIVDDYSKSVQAESPVKESAQEVKEAVEDETIISVREAIESMKAFLTIDPNNVSTQEAIKSMEDYLQLLTMSN